MSSRRVLTVVSLAAATALSTAALVPAAGSTPGRQSLPAQAIDVTAAHQSAPHRAFAGQRPAVSSRPTATQRALRRYGYLVPHPAAYARAKTLAAARSVHPVSPVAPGPLAPVRTSDFSGVRGLRSVPSDSTGAVGTARYVELVNSKYGIYGRANTLLGRAR